MDKPISVGDLVMLFRPTPCCGNTLGLGKPFQVLALTRTVQVTCLACGKRYMDAMSVHEILPNGQAGGHIVSRLKRIPPPKELGIADEKEELHA